MKPHRGTLVLVLGILSLVMCGIFTGIPAWILGSKDLKEMGAGQMDPSGRSVTNAGKICGIIGTVLWGIGIIIWLFILVFGIMGAALSQQ